MSNQDNKPIITYHDQTFLQQYHNMQARPVFRAFVMVGVVLGVFTGFIVADRFTPSIGAVWFIMTVLLFSAVGHLQMTRMIDNRVDDLMDIAAARQMAPEPVEDDEEMEIRFVQVGPNHRRRAYQYFNVKPEIEAWLRTLEPSTAINTPLIAAKGFFNPKQYVDTKDGQMTALTAFKSELSAIGWADWDKDPNSPAFWIGIPESQVYRREQPDNHSSPNRGGGV